MARVPNSAFTRATNRNHDEMAGAIDPVRYFPRVCGTTDSDAPGHTLEQVPMLMVVGAKAKCVTNTVRAAAGISSL